MSPITVAPPDTRPPRGVPPRCHPHRHVEEVDGRRYVVTHDHCHRHVPRSR